MINLPATIALPLKVDTDGSVRVSGTRVTLYTLINFYKQGYTPEDLHAAFDTVPLADIYAVIGYYLANRETVEDHLSQVDATGDQWRARWESEYTPQQRARTEHFRKLLEQEKDKADDS